MGSSLFQVGVQLGVKGATPLASLVEPMTTVGGHRFDE
jgi:hypothetical protein